MARALTATVISMAGVLSATGVAGLIAARYWERSRVAYSSVRRSAGLPPLGSLAGRPSSLLGGLLVGRPPARRSGGVEQRTFEVVTIVRSVVVEAIALRTLGVVEVGVTMMVVTWALRAVAFDGAAGVKAHGLAVVAGIAGAVMEA